MDRGKIKRLWMGEIMMLRKQGADVYTGNKRRCREQQVKDYICPTVFVRCLHADGQNDEVCL